MTEKDRLAAARARSQHLQTVVNAYHRTLGTEEGQLVLQDIAAVFGCELPAFIPLMNKAGSPTQYDPLYAAIRDGQRSVLLHIKARLSVPVTGDGNVEEPKTKVIT